MQAYVSSCDGLPSSVSTFVRNAEKHVRMFPLNLTGGSRRELKMDYWLHFSNDSLMFPCKTPLKKSVVYQCGSLHVV